MAVFSRNEFRLLERLVKAVENIAEFYNSTVNYDPDDNDLVNRYPNGVVDNCTTSTNDTEWSEK